MTTTSFASGPKEAVGDGQPLPRVQKGETKPGEGARRRRQHEEGERKEWAGEETTRRETRGCVRRSCTPTALRWHADSALTALIFFPLSLLIWAPVLLMLFTRKLLTKAGILSAEPELPDFAKGRPRLFFDGTGHLFPYSLGATSIVMEHYNVKEETCFFAISGGNISALCLLLGKEPIEVLKEQEVALAEHARKPLGGLLSNMEPLRKYLENMLPEDIHVRATGKLAVVITSWPYLGFHFLNKFTSKDVLIDAVIASCRFPFLSWRPQILPWGPSIDLKNLFVFDAGLQNAVTPLDPIMDLSIRVFPRYTGDNSLVPQSFKTSLKLAATPLQHHHALKVMHFGRTDAFKYFQKRDEDGRPVPGLLRKTSVYEIERSTC